MLILILILTGIAFLFLLGLLRAKKEAASCLKQAGALMNSRAEYERALRAEMANSLESQLSVFRTSELRAAVEIARKEVRLEYDSKLAREIEKQRAEAIKQSKAVNRGLVAEQLAPHMVGFPYNPKDCHFIGQPVDYVIFSGLDAGKCERIILLEIKTGESSMNARERQVRDVVQAGSVSYEIFRLEES